LLLAGYTGLSSKPISRRILWVVGRFYRSVDVPVECVLPGLRGTILVTGGMHLISKPVPPPELKLFKLIPKQEH
jgi:hypothetical protein